MTRAIAMVRRIPALAFAPVLLLVTLLAWAFASPIGAGPDDDYHLVSSWCAGPTAAESCAPVDGEPGFHRIPAQLADISCFQRSAASSAACQDELFAAGFTERTVVTDRGNFYGEYPPVYYAVMGLFTSTDVQTSALLMRAFTVVLFIGILTALYLLLPAGRRPTLLIGWLITTVPLGVFLLSVNNPSAWAVIGVGTSWIALLGYFETDGRRRVALGVLYALSMLMAAGSRGDAAVYAGFATVLVLVYAFRKRRAFLLASILPLVMGLVALFFLLRAGQIGSGLGGLSEVPTTPDGSPTGGSDDPSATLSGLGLLAYNALNAPFLWAGAFGEWGLGWLDTGMPPVVVFGAFGAFLVAIFLGLRNADARKLVVVGVAGLALWAIPVYVLQRGGQVVGESLQPRYLLPLIVLFGGLIALGTPLVRWTRGQLLLVAGALALAQALALHANLRRYLTGAGTGGLNLNEGIEWWWDGVPFSPMVVWVLGSLAYAGLVALIATSLRPRPVEVGVREARALA